MPAIEDEPSNPPSLCNVHKQLQMLQNVVDHDGEVGTAKCLQYCPHYAHVYTRKLLSVLVEGIVTVHHGTQSHLRA